MLDHLFGGEVVHLNDDAQAQRPKMVGQPAEDVVGNGLDVREGRAFWKGELGAVMAVF